MEKLKNKVFIEELFANKADRKKVLQEKSDKEKRFVLKMYVKEIKNKSSLILVVYDKWNMRNVEGYITSKSKVYGRYLGIVKTYNRDLLIIDNLEIEQYEN